MNKVEDILLKLLDQQADIKAHMAEVKADLREHMRRTSILEVEIANLRGQDEKLHRQVYLVHGGLGLVALVGTIVGIILGLQRIVLS